jgi:hypothetical protein
MCITGQLPDPITAGVWWRDDAVWRLYQDAQANLIRQARQNGQASVNLHGVLNCIQPVIGEAYTVDLRTMQQRSPRGFLRPVLIVDVGAVAAGGPVAVQVRKKGQESVLMAYMKRQKASHLEQKTERLARHDALRSRYFLSLSIVVLSWSMYFRREKSDRKVLLLKFLCFEALGTISMGSKCANALL